MRFKDTIALLLSGWIVFGTLSPQPLGAQTQPEPPPAAQADQPPPPVVTQSAEQLQQLVAPIALYPDALVAQILAAATYPTQIVEADRWMQQHSNLKGQELGQAVDTQPWDPSVKALTQFPSVLANMDKNLSWTSSLGEAYVNQQQDVMNAVQVMRARAQSTGNLKSNAHEKVVEKGPTIVIEPVEPDVVYVPAYDPWIVYGAPIVAWPGWYAYPGLYIGVPGISFGIGFGIGLFAGFGWGWHHWGFDWAHRAVVFNHATYISHSRTFINRNRFVSRNTMVNHNTFANHNTVVNHNTTVNHNAFVDHNTIANHAGRSAFGGFNHGGIAMDHSFRGRSSFGGGFHGGSHGGRR